MSNFKKYNETVGKLAGVICKLEKGKSQIKIGDAKQFLKILIKLVNSDKAVADLFQKAAMEHVEILNKIKEEL